MFHSLFPWFYFGALFHTTEACFARTLLITSPIDTSLLGFCVPQLWCRRLPQGDHWGETRRLGYDDWMLPTAAATYTPEYWDSETAVKAMAEDAVNAIEGPDPFYAFYVNLPDMTWPKLYALSLSGQGLLPLPSDCEIDQMDAHEFYQQMQDEEVDDAFASPPVLEHEAQDYLCAVDDPHVVAVYPYTTPVSLVQKYCLHCTCLSLHVSFAMSNLVPFIPQPYSAGQFYNETYCSTRGPLEGGLAHSFSPKGVRVPGVPEDAVLKWLSGIGS